MTNKANLKEIELYNKVVLLRVDFNVPIQKGKITDNTRIKRSLATISFLQNRGAKIVLLSHFGRPQGKVIREYSLAPLVDELSKLLNGTRIKFGVEAVGKAAIEAISELQPGQIILMENLRFHSGEEANDLDFVKALASYGDVFINDAFSCCHRPHASIIGLPEFLPSYAGFLLEEELQYLHNLFNSSLSPKMAIVGGAKISTKINLLFSLVEKLDILAIGGAMAHNFLKRNGHIGQSLYEPDYLEVVEDICAHAKKSNCHLILPTDVVVTKAPGTALKLVDVEQLEPDDIIYDIGNNSCLAIMEGVKKAKLLIWNGPLGAFEVKPFDIATNWVGRGVSYLTGKKALISIIGGGELNSALTQIHLTEQFSYVSTGGGAFLEWLEGQELVGINALNKQHS